MGNQRVVAHEIGYRPHHLGGRRCLANHLVGDSGQRFDKGRNPHAGVHQALIAVDDLAVLENDGGNLGGTVTLER